MLHLSGNHTEHDTHGDPAASVAQHAEQAGVEDGGGVPSEGEHSEDAGGPPQEGGIADEQAGWTDDDSGDEDVQWQVVAKSQNSARRKKRRVPSILLPHGNPDLPLQSECCAEPLHSHFYYHADEQFSFMHLCITRQTITI